MTRVSGLSRAFPEQDKVAPNNGVITDFVAESATIRQLIDHGLVALDVDLSCFIVGRHPPKLITLVAQALRDPGVFDVS